MCHAIIPLDNTDHKMPTVTKSKTVFTPFSQHFFLNEFNIAFLYKTSSNKAKKNNGKSL